MSTNEAVTPLRLEDHVRVLTGINHYGRLGTVESFKPYEKGMLAQVRFKGTNQIRVFDVRELERVS